MTQTEKTELKEVVEQLKAINSNMLSIISRLDGNRTDSQELKERGVLNGLLYICTHKEYDDKQYTDALKQISDLPFGLSAKQMAWVLIYTPRHHDCGEQIELFIRRQFEKQHNKNEYINQIASVLRSKYSNDNNADFIEKMIARLNEM